MLMPSVKEPNFQDEVKHRTTDITGVVIAKYPEEDEEGFIRTYLDVRSLDDKIYYRTLADHWETIKAATE